MAKRRTTESKSREAKGQPLKITLPGRIYQRGTRWWWCTELPGDDKPKARPLKARGDRAATEDRARAEQIAFEMWEQAVADLAQRQVRIEADQKVAKLKAQFLEKIRDFSQVIERTTAKAEAEAKARAEAEARLKDIIAAAGNPDFAPIPQPQELAMHPVETASCECCRGMDIPVSDLTPIDSGQLLCPDCLAALKMEAECLESPAQTRCHVS